MTKNNTNENNNINYGFYSKVLSKPFDSLDELMSAEETYYAEQKMKEDKAAQKKADAKKVEDALKALNTARKSYKEDLIQLTKEYAEALENLKKTFDLGKKDIHARLSEAENAYKAALNEFTDKHGSFHLTVKGDDFETTISRQTSGDISKLPGIFDIFDSIFNW